MSRFTFGFGPVKRWLGGVTKRCRKVYDVIEFGAHAEGARLARTEILSNQITPGSSNSSGITLVDEVDYVDAIGVYRNSAGRWYTGLPPGGVHHSGLTYEELYIIIKYGTHTQPPRQHIDGAAMRAISRIPALLIQAGFRV